MSGRKKVKYSISPQTNRPTSKKILKPELIQFSKIGNRCSKLVEKGLEQYYSEVNLEAPVTSNTPVKKPQMTKDDTILKSKENFVRRRTTRSSGSDISASSTPVKKSNILTRHTEQTNTTKRSLSHSSKSIIEDSEDESEKNLSHVSRSCTKKTKVSVNKYISKANNKYIKKTNIESQGSFDTTNGAPTSSCITSKPKTDSSTNCVIVECVQKKIDDLTSISRESPNLPSVYASVPVFDNAAFNNEDSLTIDDNVFNEKNPPNACRNPLIDDIFHEDTHISLQSVPDGSNTCSSVDSIRRIVDSNTTLLPNFHICDLDPDQNTDSTSLGRDLSKTKYQNPCRDLILYDRSFFDKLLSEIGNSSTMINIKRPDVKTSQTDISNNSITDCSFEIQESVNESHDKKTISPVPIIEEEISADSPSIFHNNIVTEAVIETSKNVPICDANVKDNCIIQEKKNIFAKRDESVEINVNITGEQNAENDFTADSHSIIITEAVIEIPRNDFLCNDNNKSTCSKQKEKEVAAFQYDLGDLNEIMYEKQKSDDESFVVLEKETQKDYNIIDNVLLSKGIDIDDDCLLLKDTKSKSNQSKKRRNTTKFRQSCMDFVLDDEDPALLDFSAGSSDLWSEKDDLKDSSDDEVPKKKRKTKKKTNKVEDETLKPKKKETKTNKTKVRKERKQKGLDYTTILGKEKKAREMEENPCKEGKFNNKCYELTEERRKSIFDYFWSLTDEKKRDWISQCCMRVPIKRKKTKSLISRRETTYAYYINEDEGRRKVCQQFIIKTLNISQTFILYTLSNVEEGLSKQDQRKRTADCKFDEDTKKFAKDYIETLPVVPSHYTRKNSTKLYLPQEFKNQTNLYRLYVKYCQENSKQFLSEKIFVALFQEYNYSFHVPKKDKCTICTQHENNPEGTNENIMKSHKEEKDATYKRFELHQNLIDRTAVTASFDLQKVLATPHGESMILYYTRKYAVYNLTVYESRTQKTWCYTWGESNGKRGSCEIGTCLFKYLHEVDSRGFKKLILYCDNCLGQNKNKVILSILHHFLQISKNLMVIQINYLLVGHTYMPVDSVHAVIEREVRKLIVWAPSQWPSFMEAARKNPFPYQVQELEHQDFIDWEKFSDKTFTPTTMKNKDLRLRDIRVCTFKKTDLKNMKIKYSMLEESKSYDIELSKPGKTTTGRKQPDSSIGKGKGKRKGKGKSLPEQVLSTSVELGSPSVEENCYPRLYDRRLPISNVKYKDLKKLCESNTIPRRFHAEYLNLPHEAAVLDTLLETDEEDEDAQ